ncbi:hypothetical protein [Mameliella alba]|uniref:hypothetical protein n=1 Tax=Mameliella alba TaxID=561184 RepID=UPI0010548919|nr:hypothetical protein [Mameliella alba]MBY6121189.1 hypothetical protein [Mameliella alba]
MLIIAMFQALAFRLVVAFLTFFAAHESRAESIDVICSNMSALNSPFVFLLARHLDFEPNVAINPSQSEIVAGGDVGTVRLVISGRSYNDVLACTDALKIERVVLERRIRTLRKRLGKLGEPIFPGAPRGTVTSLGEAVTVEGVQLFISVSVDDDAIAATEAVLQAQNLNSQTCWSDAACLSAVEAYWSNAAK